MMSMLRSVCTSSRFLINTVSYTVMIVKIIMDLIERLEQIEILRWNPVKLKHAGESDVYIDIKKAYGYPDVLNYISDELYKMLPAKTTCIAAEGFGGISPASVIAAKYDMKLTLVRNELKAHGMNRWIDGYHPTKKDKIAIIDDVFTTGGSLRHVINVLNPYNILGCLVVVKRGDGELAVPLYRILTYEE